MDRWNNELYHHGIHGQKWGVRRFQNPDGSYTPAGKKRYAKLDSYRAKLERKAGDRARERTNAAKRYEDDVSDLKKNGVNSRAYKEWKEKADRERESDFNYELQRENERLEAMDGIKTYSTATYKNSHQKIINDLSDTINSKTKISELISENSVKARENRAAAKSWVDKQKNLKSMKIDVFMSKNDIRRRYGTIFDQ